MLVTVQFCHDTCLLVHPNSHHDIKQFTSSVSKISHGKAISVFNDYYGNCVIPIFAVIGSRKVEAGQKRARRR